MSIKIVRKGFVKLLGVGGWTEVNINSLIHFEKARSKDANIYKDKFVVFGIIGESLYLRVKYDEIKQVKFSDEKIEIENTHKNKIVDDVFINYRKYWLDKVKLSYTQKAENLTIFNFLYKITYDREPDYQIKNKVVKKQLLFFNNNKKRIHPNPAIFEEFFPNKKMGLDVWKSSAFRLIENVIIADKTESRNYQF